MHEHRTSDPRRRAHRTIELMYRDALLCERAALLFPAHRGDRRTIAREGAILDSLVALTGRKPG